MDLELFLFKKLMNERIGRQVIDQLINLEKNLAVQEINSKKQTKIDKFFNPCNNT